MDVVVRKLLWVLLSLASTFSPSSSHFVMDFIYELGHARAVVYFGNDALVAISSLNLVLYLHRLATVLFFAPNPKITLLHSQLESSPAPAQHLLSQTRPPTKNIKTLTTEYRKDPNLHVPHFQHLPISCRTQAATPNRPAPGPKAGWTGPCAAGLNGGGYRLTGRVAFAVTCTEY